MINIVMPQINMKNLTNINWLGKWSFPIALAAILSSVGFISIVVFTFHPSFNDLSFNLSPELASKFGSFIGGLVGPILALARGQKGTLVSY